MPDEADPPRKFYGFKPTNFDRANEVPSVPAPESPRPDPGITAAPGAKIEVRELIRAGAGDGKQLGSNQARISENEVHQMLRENYAKGKLAGDFDLGVLDDSKRRRRIRNYWILIAVIDAPLGAFAWFAGSGNAIPFVTAIAAIGMCTALLTWRTFFLRTHY